MSTFTVYVQILPEDDTSPLVNDWTPWIGCTDVRETAALAADRHIEERGGVLEGEVYTFRVVAFTDAMGRYPNGMPMRAHDITFKANAPVESEVGV